MNLQNPFYAGNEKRSMNYDEKKVFLRIIRSGNYEGAKEFAEILIERKNVEITSINKVGFDLVERLRISNPENAKNLCEIFTDYRWNNWLL